MLSGPLWMLWSDTSKSIGRRSGRSIGDVIAGVVRNGKGEVGVARIKTHFAEREVPPAVHIPLQDIAFPRCLCAGWKNML
jgi:hypothetical protein